MDRCWAYGRIAQRSFRKQPSTAGNIYLVEEQRELCHDPPQADRRRWTVPLDSDVACDFSEILLLWNSNVKLDKYI